MFCPIPELHEEDRHGNRGASAVSSLASPCSIHFSYVQHVSGMGLVPNQGVKTPVVH